MKTPTFRKELYLKEFRLWKWAILRQHIICAVFFSVIFLRGVKKYVINFA
jgi:hypothetical protein